MESSLFVFVPWVGLQMVTIWVLVLTGLVAVTMRLAQEPDPSGSRQAAAQQDHGQRPAEPLTPEWLERLISGVGHPPAPRPRPAERDAGAREVA